jgi:hypothetical protein
MTGRELDIGVCKTFSITERLKFQLRGEAYNILNHADFYVIGSGANVSSIDVYHLMPRLYKHHYQPPQPTNHAKLTF